MKTDRVMEIELTETEVREAICEYVARTAGNEPGANIIPKHDKVIFHYKTHPDDDDAMNPRQVIDRVTMKLTLHPN